MANARPSRKFDSRGLTVHHPAVRIQLNFGILLVAIPLACNSSESAPAAPGPPPDASAQASGFVDAALPDVDAATRADALDPAQKAQLCDWLNGLRGGYGAVIAGPGDASLRKTDPDQATCVATRFDYACPITVGQIDLCLLAEANAEAGAFPFENCRPLTCPDAQP
jgi:hypothetical protein